MKTSFDKNDVNYKTAFFVRLYPYQNLYNVIVYTREFIFIFYIKILRRRNQLVQINQLWYCLILHCSNQMNQE